MRHFSLQRIIKKTVRLPEVEFCKHLRYLLLKSGTVFKYYLFQDWSGVQEIIPREITGSRKTDLVYVTTVGTVLARQRLARLLLLSGETIRDAIANDVIPPEVRDEFL